MVHRNYLKYLNENQRGYQGLGLDFSKDFSIILAMNKKPQHGGKRKGAGRKPKPPDERRGETFAFAVSLLEKKLLEESDARTWARETLLKMAARRLKR